MKKYGKDFDVRVIKDLSSIEDAIKINIEKCVQFKASDYAINENIFCRTCHSSNHSEFLVLRGYPAS